MQAKKLQSESGVDNRQLHDAHPQYNDNVKDTLLDVATKMDGMWVTRDLCRAVRKLTLHFEKDVAMGRFAQPILSERRAQNVAAQTLEHLSVVGFDPHIGVKVEAYLACLKS